MKIGDLVQPNRGYRITGIVVDITVYRETDPRSVHGRKISVLWGDGQKSGEWSRDLKVVS